MEYYFKFTFCYTSIMSKATPYTTHLLKITLFGGIFASVFSLLFEKFIFLASLMVHFQLQYVICIFVSSLLLGYFQKTISGIIGVTISILLCIFVITPIQFTSPNINNVDIFFINMLYTNTEVQPIIDAIKTADPESIAIVESNMTMTKQIQTQLNKMPAIDHRAFAGSCTVYTTKEPHRATVTGQTHIPICTISFENYDLLVVHAHQPTAKTILEENITFFNTLKKRIEAYEKEHRHFIIVGDFNATVYSDYFTDFFDPYIKTNSYTWQADTPLALPIDHVISNMNIEYAVSSDLGSDHRALLIDIK